MNIKFPAFEAIDIKNDVAMLGISELSLIEIIPDKNQPRKIFDEQALNELSASIKQYGIIQPILVRKIEDGKYQIIAGERRWRAAHLAGLQKIPAIIQQNDVQKNVAISLIENIQREELNPIELAEALYKLSNDHCLSHEAIASMIGKNRATVTNLLRLLSLSLTVRNLLIIGKLEMGHAKALVTLPAEQQIFLANKIIEKTLSVRDTERLIQLYKLPKSNKQHPYAEAVSGWVEKLTKVLSSKVLVKINEKGEGKVIIHFASPNKMDWLVEQLENEGVQ
jgi:ParB family chromosome partitioning protein